MNEITFIENIFEFYPCESSDRLIVWFSSASAREPEGRRRLANHKINKLFVRDPNRAWYSGNIEGLSSNVETLKLAIESVTSRFDKEKVVFFGASMGGYGAILFGSLIGGHVCAVSPQIIINSKLPHCPSVDVQYVDLLAVMEKCTTCAKFSIWFGIGELSDVYQIMRCSALVGCDVHPVANACHNVLAFFKIKDLYAKFIDCIVDGVDFDYPCADLRDIPYVDVCKAVELCFLHNEFEISTDVLAQLSCPILDGAICFHIARNLRQMKDYDRAIEYFEKTVAVNPYHGEAYLNLGDMYYSRADYDRAINNYKRGLGIFNEPLPYYRTSLAGAYRVKKDFDAALSAIHSALNVAGNDPRVNYHAGLIYRDVGRDVEAVKYFQSALLLKPDMTEASNQIAHILSRYCVKEVKNRFNISAKFVVDLA